MTLPITATRPRTLGCCVACLLGQAHTVHDTSLPAVQRVSVAVPVLHKADPDIPGYLAEAVPYPPAF